MDAFDRFRQLDLLKSACGESASLTKLRYMSFRCGMHRKKPEVFRVQALLRQVAARVPHLAKGSHELRIPHYGLHNIGPDEQSRNRGREKPRRLGGLRLHNVFQTFATSKARDPIWSSVCSESQP